MNILSQMSVSYSQDTQTVQGASSHHKPKSLADMIGEMSSAIDDAVKAGKLTSEQGDTIQKQLEALADLLKTGRTGSTSSNDTSGNTPSINSDDRQMIREAIKRIGQQFFAASMSGTQVADPIDNLFSKIDGNGDKAISKSEFTTFANSLNHSEQNGGTEQSKPQTYGQHGSFSLTMVSYQQSTFSMMA